VPDRRGGLKSRPAGPNAAGSATPTDLSAMPIYAFACSACGHAFDRLQKLSDPDPIACPACAAEGTIARQLTAPQFRLAGSGWYETDFKKDGDRKRNLADRSEGGGEGGGAGGSAGGGEAKPAPSSPSPATPSAPASSAPASSPAPATAKVG
jgi:putative FmdB family regulatory protein